MKPEPAVPAEVREVFAKIEHFLNDDEMQNAAESEYLRGMMMRGEAVDRLPGATGDFGHCRTNPVPVNGPSVRSRMFRPFVRYTGSVVRPPAGCSRWSHGVRDS